MIIRKQNVNIQVSNYSCNIISKYHMDAAFFFFFLLFSFIKTKKSQNVGPSTYQAFTGYFDKEK